MKIPTSVSLGTIAGLWFLILAGNVVILPPRFLPGVQAETIHISSIPLVVRAPATLEPKRSMEMKAPFDGPVLHKNYQEGEEVQQGQFLLEIGRDKIRTDYQNTQVALKNAISDLAKAKREVLLQKKLFHQQAVAMSSVEDAERAEVRADQSVQAAQSAYQLSAQTWNKNKLTAPFSGTIVKDSLGDDRDVSSGRSVLTLADVSEYTLDARVDELEINEIKIGQPAWVKIQAYGDRVFNASVIRVGAQAEGSTVPEVHVFLKLDTPQGMMLLPNLSAGTRIDVGEASHIISVPLNAVDNADGRDKVWVVDSFGRIRQRNVRLGRSNPDRVEVLEGLTEGEKVCILSSSIHLVDGMRVKIHA